MIRAGTIRLGWCALLALLPLRSSQAQCSTWDAQFGAPGTDAEVSALAVFDDGLGGGPQLYAGGLFLSIGGVAANRIARWDGNTWSPLGAGMNGGAVQALIVFDDGTGPALYAGGGFLTAGGQPAARIARWDGLTWSALGAGIGNGSVRALEVHDDGSGSALYVGGAFSSAGGQPASNIARWTAAGWSNAGTLDEVYVLREFDDGTQNLLYAGLYIAPRPIKRWDGFAWSNLATQEPTTSTLDPIITSMCVWNDGSGDALYVGGSISSLGRNIGRFDGTSWSYLEGISWSPDYTFINSMIVHDDGDGPALWVTGLFQGAGGMLAGSLARWNGSSWSTPHVGLTGDVRMGNALASHDDGTGPALIAGGRFTHAGGIASHNLARLSALGGLPAASAVSGPSSATVGDIVQLSITATGVGTLSYDWKRGGLGNSGPGDGSGWSGTGTDTLTLQILSAGLSSGDYSCVVANACGTSVSPKHALPVSAGPGVVLCDGYTGCPCGNFSDTHLQGCANSIGGYGWLAAQGVASVANDTLTLLSANTTDASVLYIQGSSPVSAVILGDGMRCAGGTIIRLGLKTASGGAAQHPGPGDLALSSAGALAGGETIIYQAVYRDAAMFCTGGTFNLTNAVSVAWAP